MSLPLTQAKRTKKYIPLFLLGADPALHLAQAQTPRIKWRFSESRVLLPLLRSSINPSKTRERMYEGTGKNLKASGEGAFSIWVLLFEKQSLIWGCPFIHCPWMSLQNSSTLPSDLKLKRQHEEDDEEEGTRGLPSNWNRFLYSENADLHLNLRRIYQTSNQAQKHDLGTNKVRKNSIHKACPREVRQTADVFICGRRDVNLDAWSRHNSDRTVEFCDSEHSAVISLQKWR